MTCAAVTTVNIITYVFDLIVSNPYIESVSALNAQIVGQSLTLECRVTVMRGITSRVDVVWSSDGSSISTLKGINMSKGSNAQYSEMHVIPQLSTMDDGRVYQCDVVINTRPPVMATSNITLNVIGLFYTSVLHFTTYNLQSQPLMFLYYHLDQ